MKRVFFLLLISIILIPNVSAEATTKSDMAVINPSCTIFTVSIGDTVFFGNNEDWRGDLGLRLWFMPSQNISTIGGERSIYGSVGIGFLDEEKGELYLNPCGGMNEHGLMFDINGLPSKRLFDNPNGSEFWTNSICYIHPTLWDCKTVDEVIEWYKTYKWDTTMGGQIHYGDASGNAVVISADPITHKLAFTHKTGNFLVSTNFNLNNTNNAYDYPCSRHYKATKMLGEIDCEENLTVQACADILYEVHIDGGINQCHTLFSNIFDPVNLDVYLNYGDEYKKQRKVNLLQELSRTNSFQECNISYMTGVEGNLLIKSVAIDDDFYSPPLDSVYVLSYLAVSVISIAIVVYIYRTKVK